MSYDRLKIIAAVLLIIFLSAILLYHAKPVLLPLAFAAFIAMLLVPVCRWLQGKGVNKVVAILCSILLVVIFFGGIGALLGWQVADLSKDMKGLEEKISERYTDLRNTISEKFGVSPEKQKEMIEKQQQSSGGGMSSMVMGFLSGIGGFLTNIVLVMVYVFLFLYLRNHLKNFLIKAVPANRQETMEVVDRAQKVSQKYLMGMALMIFTLWVMYGIGFSIVGVKHAIFFAILCGLLEIVPFIGNLLGTSLTILFSLAQGGSNLVVGIIITYAVVQFIQTYILEPLIVGSEVNINPLFTIFGLVAAELIWGIPGMILAIPVMGVTKIIFDHVEPLKPYGFLMGEEKKQSEGNFKKKMNSLVEKLKKKS